jgi:CubicO group peptidase (beta-lactamase class C family)
MQFGRGFGYCGNVVRYLVFPYLSPAMKKLIAFVIVLTGLYLLAPIYIQRGITLNFSDIDDYKHFDNAVMPPQPGKLWPVAIDVNAVPSDSFLKAIEDLKTVAYLVIQDDTIRYEKYWRGHTDTTISGSFSMAKSVVSLLMGISVEEGKVNSIEDPISKYIPEFSKPGTDSISIRHLLAMSGGFNWKEQYQNPFGKTAKAYYGDDLKGLIGKLEAERKPGEYFVYSSNETQILAWILENVYGKPIVTLAAEKIWQPIGAEHPALWSLDKANGTAKAFCCINATARDFARLGKLVLHKGRVDSQQIVPEAYIREATSPASWLKDKEGNPVNFYGYQFWIYHYKGMQIPYFRGVKGQFIFIIPEKNAVVVRMGEYVSRKRVHYTPPELSMYLDAAMEVLK